ncbi:MAG TPA: PadR family transcriptional regulator [Moraxellaceae bacterium]|nr:PadR family transcriptional regulator [Moraxellaceae bacterium]
MSLPHALLTSLTERPCSGMDLAHRFDRSIGYFWPATHQQIYRELGRLEEAGWVASAPAETGRGRKRIYQVLPAGREELRRWMLEPEEPRALRDEMMVRLRAEAAIGPTGLEGEVRRRLGLHQAMLAHYREIEARDFTGKAGTRERQLQYLVLTSGILAETAQIEVLTKALAILEGPED